MANDIGTALQFQTFPTWGTRTDEKGSRITEAASTMPGRKIFSGALGMIMPAPEGGQREDLTQGAIVEPAASQVAAVPVTATPSSLEQDRIAVQAALAGDQLAFGDLVTRYQSAVYNMAYRMLGDPTEAEDAAQEVFVRAWNQLRTFQLDRRFSTWLLSIASHHCIDLLRRRKPSAPLDDVALYAQSDEPEPDELVLRDEQRAFVQSMLQKLPEKYRSVTVLRYYNDLSYDEIAQMTGLSESAVKTQLHRARRMLAEQFMRDKSGDPQPVSNTYSTLQKGGA